MNIVEQAVEERLNRDEVPLIDWAKYKGVARGVLSVLWREGKGELGPAAQQQLARKLSDWQRQHLDMALVADVQRIVADRFQQLLAESPELFSREAETETGVRN